MANGFTEWPRASAQSAGFEGDVEAALEAGVRDGKLAGLHAVVVARHGQLAFERYYAGEDEDWGTPLGEVAFNPSTLHDMRSISKSVVSLLYGIALADGTVPALDASIVEHFDYEADDDHRRMTVGHALTMSLGIEWDETLPYTDPRNGEIAMEQAPARYQYILERPVVEAPGTRWNYCGGAPALLARLIADGSGQPLLEYARERLFEPLGIHHSEWRCGADGEPAAASGLRLRPTDLARIGQLIIDRGRWGDREIIPAAWIDAACQPRLPAEDFLWYGYLLWVGHGYKPGTTWAAGFGNGGQRLMVMPHLGITIVTCAGLYNQAEHWRLPVAVVTEYIMPSCPDRRR